MDHRLRLDEVGPSPLQFRLIVGREVPDPELTKLPVPGCCPLGVGGGPRRVGRRRLVERRLARLAVVRVARHSWVSTRLLLRTLRICIHDGEEEH